MTCRTFFIVVLGLFLPFQLAHAQHDDHEALGEVHFEISCSDEAQERFNEGLAHLHHMMYEQARPAFEGVAEAEPECAMAHWGVAMTSFQPLWAPTDDEGLKRGREAIERARAIGGTTDREAAHLRAVDAFFTDPDPPRADRPSDHEARVRAWKDAQREVHEQYPDDVDAAAFYALSKVAYAMTQFSPDEEHDYALEREAGALLEDYLETHPEHPGLFHYLIHAYDSAELAHKGEEVARGYDQLAPDTPHALHMPSHLFVRMGKWEETAEWNERSAEAAAQHPYNGKVSMHYIHALDYVMYAYLQLGQDQKAQETLERVRAIDAIQPNFAAAYGLAAAQARYYLEQGKWDEAAALTPRQPEALNWDAHPGAEALFHYARGLGAARSGDLEQAEAEKEKIKSLVATMENEGDTYWATMTRALGQAVDAWTMYEHGDTDKALALMNEAAVLEESMDKHPITPGEILPVRELYGELLLKEGRESEAAEAFEAALERTPNRHNAQVGIEQAMADR